jgi:hypothetical protein
MVVACLALIVALSESTYAAVLNVPVSSVGTAQLKANAVISSKVKNHSLLAVDFKTGQLPVGAPGPKGDKGDKGDQGDKGDAGSPGVSGYEIVTAHNEVTNLGFNGVTVRCPAGKKALGGGGGTGSGLVAGDGPYIIYDSPIPDGTGWGVETLRATPGDSHLVAYVICANVS